MRIAEPLPGQIRQAGETGDSMVPVSVVIPCYRCADTIERALLSVLGQSALPCQVVMVNDGSSDDDTTREELVRLEHRFSGVLSIETLLLERRVGPAGARNAGWSRATGEYVAFLDADDTWHSRKLAVQYDWMRGHGEIALSGARLQVSSGETVGESVIKNLHARPISTHSLLVHNTLPTSTVMLRRDLGLRFDIEQMRCQDYLLWLEVVSSGNRVAKLDAVLAYCYKPLYGAGGQTGNLRAMEAAELSVLRRIHQMGYIGSGLWAVSSCWSLLKHVVRATRVLSRHCWRARDKHKACRAS